MEGKIGKWGNKAKTLWVMPTHNKEVNGRIIWKFKTRIIAYHARNHVKLEFDCSPLLYELTANCKIKVIRKLLKNYIEEVNK